MTDAPEEVARLRAAAEAGFYLLAAKLSSHRFRLPRHAFDMRCFAPEAKEFLSTFERTLYNACARIAGVEHG